MRFMTLLAKYKTNKRPFDLIDIMRYGPVPVPHVIYDDLAVPTESSPDGRPQVILDHQTIIRSLCKFLSFDSDLLR